MIMEETKKLAIPEGYEFDRVEDGEVVLKKKETALPKAWNEIKQLLGEMDFIMAIVPDGMADEIRLYATSFAPETSGGISWSGSRTGMTGKSRSSGAYIPIRV